MQGIDTSQLGKEELKGTLNVSSVNDLPISLNEFTNIRTQQKHLLNELQTPSKENTPSKAEEYITKYAPNLKQSELQPKFAKRVRRNRTNVYPRRRRIVVDEEEEPINNNKFLPAKYMSTMKGIPEQRHSLGTRAMRNRTSNQEIQTSKMSGQVDNTS